MADSDDYTQRVVPFRAGDGLELNLINVRGRQPAGRGPVLLVHGAGVRANVFRAPVDTSIVQFLVDRGHDVWLENWRASIDLPPNEWTLDQAAVHDHPNAVRTVLEETGASSLDAVIHCQGSTSFMMSAVAGLVPQVKTVVANAVSLHTLVPTWSRFKIRYVMPVMRPLLPYVNPQWGLKAPNAVALAISLGVRLVHHECDNPVCKMVSFTYGAGFPALWRHENLNPATHEWIKHEFGDVPISFFVQMDRCVRRGHLISVDGFKELPEDFVAQPPQTDARFVFIAGRLNQCFLPESQRRTYEWFAGRRQNYHAFHELPSYSHLDVFLGKSAAQDVFPMIAAELEKKAA
jgi:pimeloyl-ACP methyl ester carboxylesterase